MTNPYNKTSRISNVFPSIKVTITVNDKQALISGIIMIVKQHEHKITDAFGNCGIGVEKCCFILNIQIFYENYNKTLHAPSQESRCVVDHWLHPLSVGSITRSFNPRFHCAAVHLKLVAPDGRSPAEAYGCTFSSQEGELIGNTFSSLWEIGPP